MPRKVSKTISASVLSAKRNSANRDAAASRASVTKVPTGGRLLVPAGKRALSALQMARASTEALQHFSGPAPDMRKFEVADIDRVRFPAPGIVRLVRPFSPAHFASKLSARLDAQNVGYAFQVNEHGVSKARGARGFCRHAVDGGVPWDSQSRMHVASTSKFFSAVALMRALRARGLDVDAKINDFLPRHWSIGQKARGLTFKRLLTHQAGLYSGNCDYAALKQEVASAGDGIGEVWHYANSNYALMRILIPILDGTLQRDVDYASVVFKGVPSTAALRDVAWDVLTRKHFNDYLQTHVWRPSGVTFASLRSTRSLWNLPPFSSMPSFTDAAIGYGYPPVAPNAPGVDISEDLTAAAGAVGWHVSCDELLAAANAIRYGGSILPKATVSTMLREHYGIFGEHTNDNGRLSFHDGIWSASYVSEWAYLGFVNGTHELAVLTNNARDENGKTLGLLRDTIHASFDDSYS